VSDRGVPGATAPAFDAPPVVEVALGLQFSPLLSLRTIEMAALREHWRSRYPIVQEQPPLPATIESASGVSQVQFVVGPGIQSRIWFLDEAQVELVQLQNDRLTVNWRQIVAGTEYPHYAHVRSIFAQRLSDLVSFVDESQLGTLEVTQVEVTYINAIEPADGKLGRLEHALRTWEGPTVSTLGDLEQARTALVFSVLGFGRPPVRMYVAAEPAHRPTGDPVIFLTLTVRGAPEAETAQAALEFMDQAHDVVIKSFVELTPDEMQEKWGRRQ